MMKVSVDMIVSIVRIVVIMNDCVVVMFGFLIFLLEIVGIVIRLEII